MGYFDKVIYPLDKASQVLCLTVHSNRIPLHPVETGCRMFENCGWNRLGQKNVLKSQIPVYLRNFLAVFLHRSQQNREPWWEPGRQLLGADSGTALGSGDIGGISDRLVQGSPLFVKMNG